MKKCPVCGKIYGYEQLRFCRFDGVRLVDIVLCEAPTILLQPHEIPHKTGGPVESVTGEYKINHFN